jgi:S-adenosylmethionine/arginine decarboxylase-like enzyme
MCYNCGCHIPDDDMGDPDNITGEMMKKVSKQLGVKGDGRKLVYDYLETQLTDAEAKNPVLEEMFKKAAKAWGQTIKEAKRQTYNLLKSEL